MLTADDPDVTAALSWAQEAIGPVTAVRPLVGGWTSTMLALTTVATTGGAVTLVPAAVVVGGPFTTDDATALGALVYLGVMTMALAYGLLYAGLRTTSSAAAVIASLLEPVTAAVVAALFLDERVGVLGIVGIVLVLAAVAGAGREPVAEAGPASGVRESPG